MDNRKLSVKNLLLIVFGTLLYVCSVNWFIIPLGLYSGGVVGLSQVLRTLFFSHWQYDAAGIINFLLNVPLFVLAYKSLNKRILFGTAMSLLIQGVCFTLIPVPTTPILTDRLASILLGAITGGVGCGIVLTSGASAGGLDLLGVYLAQVKKDFSVGKLSMFFNAALYGFCAWYSNLEIALLSTIYIAIYSFSIDRFHYQNIEVQLMIFTRHPEIKTDILRKHVRGVTCWPGVGAYTGKDTEVLVTVVAKNQVEAIKKDIMAIDPDAFIIVSEGMHVTGGYQKRLV